MEIRVHSLNYVALNAGHIGNMGHGPRWQKQTDNDDRGEG